MEIHLHGKRGGVALIDDGLPSVAWILERRWYQGKNGYVVTNTPTAEPGPRQVYLHRVVSGCVKGDGIHVDHWDHNKLDNRSANLRPGTRAKNSQNMAAHCDAVSRFRGVWLDKRGRWFGDRMVNGVRTRVGPFVTELEAGLVTEALP